MDDVVQQWILDTYCIPANKEASGKLGEYMPADYADPISYVVSTSPLEFSAFCKQLLRQQQLRHLCQ